MATKSTTRIKLSSDPKCIIQYRGVPVAAEASRMAKIKAGKMNIMQAKKAFAFRWRRTELRQKRANIRTKIIVPNTIPVINSESKTMVITF